jgi:hypothetical protein
LFCSVVIMVNVSDKIDDHYSGASFQDVGYW